MWAAVQPGWLHDLALVTLTLGGVSTLGMVGLFVGPVLMALLVAIWREWVRGLDDESDRRQSA